VSQSDDPLSTLQAGSIPQRAEAARELAASGSPETLNLLIETALTDKSPGVRLASAAAAAHVLARCRLGERRDLLSTSQRRAVLSRLRGIDPGRNTGLFQVLASLGMPEVLRNLTSGVRDPRVDVRTGALVGLERYCASGAVNGDPRVPRALLALVEDPRLKPDVLVELAGMALRLGFYGLRDEIERASAQVPTRWVGGLRETLGEYPPELTADAVQGVWLSRGLDCGEQRARALVRQWLVLLPGHAVRGSEGELALSAWELGDGSLVFAPAGQALALPLRRLQARLEGGEGVDVLQVGAVSYRAATENELKRLVEALPLSDPSHARFHRELRAAIQPGLSGRALGTYVSGALSLLAGEHGRAIEILEPLVSAGRAPVEAAWFQAQACRAAGDREGARRAAQSYLDRVGPRGSFRSQASALLEA